MNPHTRQELARSDTTRMRPSPIPLDQLNLDPHNPRLPEEIAGDPLGMVEYLIDHGVLHELGYSFLDNGFFEAERLIVIKSESAPERYTVVEGNRRLAALQCLHGYHPEHSIVDFEPTTRQLERLSEIPCLIASNRRDVESYLAHRHIGGMKTWSPEARARFLRGMVDEEKLRDATNAFRNVGRRIGSNATGVRNSYNAISIVRYATEELGIQTGQLQHQRFGVWLRAMNSSDIRSYIGFGNPTSPLETATGLAALDQVRLREVVEDFTPSNSSQRALLQDSRWITDYGRILIDSEAREVLRDTGDFLSARSVLLRRELPDQMRAICRDLERVRIDVAQNPSGGDIEELRRLARRVLAEARSIAALVDGSHNDQ